jgi:alkyl sulfatase BDS1-like metallo-beta-lactamase superfamily hydrolase
MRRGSDPASHSELCQNSSMDTVGFPSADTQDFDDTDGGIVITDRDETYVFELRNGTANHRATPAPASGSTTLTLARRTLIGLMTGRVDFPAALADGTITIDGDPGDLGRLVAVIAPTDRNFPIVTP